MISCIRIYLISSFMQKHHKYPNLSCSVMFWTQNINGDNVSLWKQNSIEIHALLRNLNNARKAFLCKIELHISVYLISHCFAHFIILTTISLHSSDIYRELDVSVFSDQPWSFRSPSENNGISDCKCKESHFYNLLASSLSHTVFIH